MSAPKLGFQWNGVGSLLLLENCSSCLCRCAEVIGKNIIPSAEDTVKTLIKEPLFMSVFSANWRIHFATIVVREKFNRDRYSINNQGEVACMSFCSDDSCFPIPQICVFFHISTCFTVIWYDTGYIKSIGCLEIKEVIDLFSLQRWPKKQKKDMSLMCPILKKMIMLLTICCIRMIISLIAAIGK